jgi:hypothetical protein
MVRFIHVSSVLSAAAAVVLLTLGMAATLNTAFADEPLTSGMCNNPTSCPCPGACDHDTINCSACICQGTTCS